MQQALELLNLGFKAHQEGRIDEAEQLYRQVLAADPANVHAWHLLGVVAFEVSQVASAQQNLAHAIACFSRAIQLNPQYAYAWSDLGAAFKELGKLDEAVASFEQAAAISPAEFKLQSNLALALAEVGQFDKALAHFDQALALEPLHPQLHWNRSAIFLLRGDFERGWEEYESRWQSGELIERNFPQPAWRGESLHGRTLLIYCEQGFGDTFQFIRYARIVKGLGAKVVVECQKALLSVLAGCPGIDELIPSGGTLPNIDFHIPLLSIPRVLGTSLSSIPAHVPYLSADPKLVQHWGRRLAAYPGFRIGIHWQGREGRWTQLKRNIPLECFARLSELPGVRLICLQKVGARQDRAAIQDRVPMVDFTDEMDGANGAFVDTAAVIANLDLVLSSDTSIPHLAGALGAPVWVALPFVPDWRWLLNRADSPWYPTMRLFRQKSVGDWVGVIQEVEAALRTTITRS